MRLVAQPPPEARSTRAGLVWSAVLLVALTVAAYLPALHAGFIWDDDQYVTANATLRSLAGLRRIWLEPGAVPQYYPLTFTSFWVEYHLWGLQPFGYHLVNVLLHTLNAVLLWRVLRQLRLSGAWAAAALFALHPMQVESVAWITERKNVLSGVFFFAACLVYLQAEAADRAASPTRIRWRPSLAVGALFVGALLSKSVTCSLPVVLILIRWWQRGAIDRRTVLTLAPLCAVGLLMASMTVWMESDHVGAHGPEFALSLLERGLVAGRVWWFYPRTLLWPRALTFIYPRWSIDTHVWWQYLFPSAALAVLLALYGARRRIGRGPLVAMLCYTGALAPALGFINVYPMRYSFVADHFAYVPIIGLIVLLTAGSAHRVAGGGQARRLLASALGPPTLLGLVLLTAQQCGIYHDLRTLWTDTLTKNPACWMAHTNLGLVLQEHDGDLKGAITHYVEALRLHPHNPEASNNLGSALAAQGQVEDAIRQYQQALHVAPDFAPAHYNLGLALGRQGQTAEAIAHFRQAVRWQPDSAEAHYNLGVALGSQGQTAEAIQQYQQAVHLNPDYPDAQNNLGVELGAQGKIADAIRHFTQAIHSKPDFAEAHHNLGSALQLVGRLDEAIAQYEEAVRLRPTDAQAQHNLRRALVAREQRKEAHP